MTVNGRQGGRQGVRCLQQRSHGFLSDKPAGILYNTALEHVLNAFQILKMAMPPSSLALRCSLPVPSRYFAT